MDVVGHNTGHVTHRWEGHCGCGQTGHVTGGRVTVDTVGGDAGHAMTYTQKKFSSHYIPAALLINTQCNYHISCMIDVTCMCNVCTYVQ